jgi:two-component system NtrC family response regulator
VILCPGTTITVADLPRNFKADLTDTLHFEGIPANASLPEILDMIEQRMIHRALRMANSVQAHAAQILGIGKSGLNMKIKKYKMDVSAMP